ncbi:cysteine-rich receptor-like protein kinase 43 [Lolium perenne]|uniref:cysteine-rich receptor-like protein kinase 43 n=1 Tax=Lolium perenne TaxID=4522 RepID=UPI0021F592A0|nr:probable serine/threonine-protein kinase PBL5 isoform X1 [Lolium perenne]XP_051223303.1 probable serine/threonine-protein kinase PBL5 isoform X1 [Lolium perenne]
MYGESSKYDSLESVLHDQCSKPRALPLQFLKDITDNFSYERLLGEGGTGTVYKGVLQSGKIIAVKRLEPSMVCAQSLFENEVHHLMRLNHQNIVQFMGYCYETKKLYENYEGKMVFAESSEMLLCLEYLPKGSLDGYLSDADGSTELDWHTRYRIIQGICNGLHYLHEKIDKSILHLDLKPGNVLLDHNLAPKISDFGLSRLLDQHQTISSPNRVGTFGYMAPEYVHEGTITPKSDIFSLGVIIMELIMGNRNYPSVTGTSSEGFIDLELKKWSKTLEKAQGYTKLEVDCQQIKRCIQIGLICVNPDWTKRPTTTKIIEMFEGLESSDCRKSSKAISSADQISKGLKKHRDNFGVTKEGNLPPKNTLCIEIFGQAERRNPEVGEASVFLAMVVDCQRGKLQYLENRVALARIMFPREARVAMDFAQVDSTLEFTLESSVNLPRRTQRPTIDLNKTPFQMKDEHLARIRDLSKTVELGKRFFPRCSSLLDKVMDETEPASLGIGRDTPSVKRKFQDLRYFLLKAFKDDKEEFDRSVLLTSCRCPLDQGV